MQSRLNIKFTLEFYSVFLTRHVSIDDNDDDDDDDDDDDVWFESVCKCHNNPICKKNRHRESHSVKPYIDMSTKFGLLIDFDLLKAVTSTNIKPEVVFSGCGHLQKWI